MPVHHNYPCLPKNQGQICGEQLRRRLRTMNMEISESLETRLHGGNRGDQNQGFAKFPTQLL